MLNSNLFNMESKDSTAAMEQTFRALTISDNNSQSESLPTSFPRFPDLPAEIRLQIWAYAILNLPGRIIPIQDISGKPRTPALFHMPTSTSPNIDS
jgi:hypothetical protein